jgi:hypothetical protein
VNFHSQSGSPLEFIFIAIVAVIAVIGSIYGAIAARKRQEGLFELAQRLNLNFDAEHDCGIPQQFDFFEQFTQGSDRYATNVLSGNYQQNKILAFDYHYTTGSGKNRQDHNLSFFILIMQGGRFPQMTIRREGFFDRVAETLGFQDIKFESAEFSKAFCVRSPDKKFAYDVCNAQMMEYLLGNRDLSVEIENEVIALAFNARISVEQFEKDLQRLIEIRSHFPEYLFTQNT